MNNEILANTKVSKASKAVKLNKKRSLNRSHLIDNLQFLALSLPTLLHIFIFCYIPMFGIIIAFKFFRFDLGIFKSPWVGLKNFTFFFTSQDAWRVTRNTIGLNFLFIVGGLVCSVIFALMMFELKKRVFIKTYQTISILPSFISWVVVGYMTYAVLEPTKGLLNNVLLIFGVDKIQWYSEPGYWPLILLITSLWHGVGYGSIIYFAGLMGIDTEYFEASALDGATKLQQIRYISLPFISPLITILTILAIGRIFRSDFGLFFNVTRNLGVLYPTTDVIDTYVYRALMSIGDIGMSAAVGLFQSIVGFILILFTNYIVRRIEPENSLF